ncbi:MAG: dihydroorotase, partial [Spirochaetia bacterium]|nr:dihydroorotase [Spirochaetia bacterium]
MIDMHVHLRDWAQRDKETLAHGMGVALLCGVDELFDMPNTSPPLTEREAILKRLEDASQCNAA